MSNNRKLSYFAGSWALLAAVVGIIFILNFASDRAFTRLDLTQNKQFTLSPSTKKVLAELPDIVTIKAVYSSNIPSPYNQFTNEVMDLLREYEVYGKGKVKLEIIDPVGKPELQEEIAGMGVNPTALPVRGLDQASTIKIYAAINVRYLNKSQVIPYAFTTETLEYELTTTIERMTAKSVPKIGFLNVDDNRRIMEEFSGLKDALSKEFEVEEVTISGDQPIGDDISVLMVLNPFKVTDRDIFEIDQYIMRGGKAVFLTDGVRIFLQKGQFGGPVPFYAMPLNEQVDSLGRLLAGYGVKRNYDLVQDKDHQNYPLFGPLGKPYPLFPIIDMRQGQVDNQITKGLDHLVFTWASSLELENVPDTVKAVKLVVTSPDSWIQSGNQLMVDPMQDPLGPLPIPGMGPAQRTLAVLLTGKFPSYFAGKPAPQPGDGNTAESAEPPERHDQSKDTDILVVGCSMFVSNQDPAPSSQNINFITSAAAWMTGGSKLADIRTRKVESRPITDFTTAKVILVGFVAPLAAPLAIIIFGIIRFTVRRTQKKRFLESVKP